MKKLFILLSLCPCIAIAQPQSLKGTVLTSAGTPITGALVTTASNKTATTNTNGTFEISIIRLPDTLVFTHIGYKQKQVAVTTITPLTIILDEAVNSLDETVIIAYGKTTRRLNTGSVSRITASDLAAQPVADPLSALAGRVTGVTVAQSSGLPGAMVSIQVRGRNSIQQGSEPLFIIDGVPFTSGNQPVNRLSSVLTTGLSPFSTISPADIESIEILKDADATAIYGSRGANGVVLITTKKGRPGKTTLNVQANHAVSTVTRTMQMMNTQQYVSMRKEAFANDGIVPSSANAPDLLLWDTTRYTDMQDYFIGDHALSTEALLSLGGGSGGTRFLLNGAYRKDGNPFPGDMHAQRVNAGLSVQHNSAANKLTIDASVAYGNNTNNLVAAGLASAMTLSPNFPAFYNTDGTIKWEHAGEPLSNPVAYLLRKYKAVAQYLNGRMQLAYKPFPGFSLGTSVGYNIMRTDESAVTPIAAQNPSGNPLGTLDLGVNSFRGWIVEPQAEYNTTLFKGKLQLMAGATLQDNTSEGHNIKATGFTSDHLLQSLAAAPQVSQKSNNYSKYRYEALFGRINYNYQNKYILNLSGRRDGSSRFGTGKRFSNFGAVGAAWLFGNETFFKKTLPVISYGKLRGSYGTSGNDQVGDYRYLDNWGAVQPYQGTTALNPQNLFNAGYRWEINRKLELALETGFFDNRLMLSLAWYRNRSGNQLVAYLLPAQTGFNSIIRNHDAVVENTGIEMELQLSPVRSKNTEWSVGANLTIPHNKLLSFKDLDKSSYANAYTIGQPLTAQKRYHYLGVDPATGIMTFEDVNKDGMYSISDLQSTVNTDPVFFGGLFNNFRYKNFSLHAFFEFRKQQGRNYLYSIYSGGNVPGMRNNLPALLLDRWQKPGDISTIQRLTTSTSGAAYAAASTLLASDGIYSDASYIRFKTIALTWQLPQKWLRNVGMQSVSINLRAQNLFTLTAYKGSDPETQDLYALPPLKTIAIGISLTF